ncbi:unnamed protein product [Caenorhabditis angaria]|uniref:Homeobox domain-containing protein n=1 Tax=Caenorhabditis angaria TaxID=860376 RepID=A0A9P1N998_9PELO|nr:unnamed protein product [Caenorhabditis angaria]
MENHSSNCYPSSSDYYSPPSSNSGASVSPQYSFQSPQDQNVYHGSVQYPQMAYDQYQEYYQQYNMCYPMQYQQPMQNMQPLEEKIVTQTTTTVCQKIYEHVENQRAPRRGTYTSQQLDALSKRFKISDRIPISERRELAKSINLTPEQIKVWFQNRRYKLKKMRNSNSVAPVESNVAGYTPY